MHQRITSKKIILFFVISSACLSLIAARLAYLQIFQTLTFFKLSQRNFLRFEKIVSPRGNIVDRNNKLLATNRPVISLYWQGTGNRHLSPEQLTLLNTITLYVPDIVINETELQNAEKLNKPLLLAVDIPFEQLSILIEQFAQHPNLLYQTDFKRFYPHKNVASHIVGYLGGLHYENSGKMGLEKICEQVLKGQPGQLAKTVNSRGKYLSCEKQKDSLLGGTINTTLDLDLSLIADAVFPEDVHGSMIIMDAQTGDLLALLSRPSFDPNIFLDPLSMQAWNDIQADQPFLNRASNACYPPASIFKLVSMAAGLETGIINQADIWVCHGHTTFVGRDYHCWQRKGHGVMTTLSAIAQSCNIPFFEIGKKIKIDTLAEYATKLGLGLPTNSLLPEKTGLIPTRKWKREVKGESWWPGETLSAAIGQSFLLVTPLQIARMINAICEGYLVTPRILADEPMNKSEVELSPETRDFLKRSMKQSIQAHGTGSQLRHLKNFEIFAKTGTGQVSSFEKRELAKEFLEQGWFVGHITYKDHPPFIMVILMEHVGSSSVVTAVALEYLKKYSKLLEAQLSARAQ
jgi:penicillin-binding protein 2